MFKGNESQLVKHNEIKLFKIYLLHAMVVLNAVIANTTELYYTVRSVHYVEL